MGISPNIWGPSTWTFIHLIVLAEKEPFDTTRTKYYKDLFQILTYILPCEKCRQHLTENLDKLPSITNIKTKRELFDWTVQLHNLVNRITNKKEWDLETAYQHWFAISTGKKNLEAMTCVSNYWKYATFLLVVILLLTFAMQRRKK